MLPQSYKMGHFRRETDRPPSANLEVTAITHLYFQPHAAPDEVPLGLPSIRSVPPNDLEPLK